MSPKVSVLLPVYNAEKYLSEAVKSILNQSFSDFELLIIDNCSFDSSLKIATSFKTDPRVKVISNSKNEGLVQSLNNGLREARGLYIARMDADDICHVDRFMKQVSFLDLNPEVGICGTAFHFMNSDTIVKMPLAHDDIKMASLAYTPFGHPTVMMRAKLLVENHLLYNPDFFLAEDYEIWTRILEKTKAANLPDVLLEYRVHQSQISAESQPQQLIADRIRTSQIKKILPKLSPSELELHLRIVRREKMNLTEILKSVVWLKKLSNQAERVKFASPSAIRKFCKDFQTVRLYNGPFKNELRMAYRLAKTLTPKRHL